MPSQILHPERPERPCSFQSPTHAVGLSPLTSTLTRNVSATALTSTVAISRHKCINIRDFKPCRFRTYTTPSLKSFRIHTYKKRGGGGEHCGRGGAPFASEHQPTNSRSAVTTKHHSPVTRELPHMTPGAIIQFTHLLPRGHGVYGGCYERA